MTIMETAIAMNNDFIDCRNTIGKINVFAEASYAEYKINLKEAALKVLKENGTEEDYDFLATEATNGYIKRAEKAIKKTIEADKAYVRKSKEKLAKMASSAKGAIDKAKEACNTNKKLSAQNVEYENTDAQIKVVEKAIADIRKRLAKIKAKGTLTVDDKNYIRDIESDTMKKISEKPSKKSIKLTDAISLFEKIDSESEMDSRISEPNGTEVTIINNIKEAEVVESVREAINIISSLEKLKTDLASKTVTSLIAGIKESFNSKKATEEVKTESEMTLDDLAIFNYYIESTEEEVQESVEETEKVEVEEEVKEVEESTEEPVEEKTEETEPVAEPVVEPIVESAGVQEGLDLDMYFESMCNELFSDAVTVEESTEEVQESVEETEEVKVEEEVQEVEESTEESESIDAELYLESLEKELFGEEDDIMAESYMENLERELFGDELTTESEKEEETKEEEFSFESATQSLLDEMESLL